MKLFSIILTLVIFSPTLSAGHFTGHVETVVVDKNSQYNNGISVVHIRTTAEHADKPAGCKSGFFVLSLRDERSMRLLELAMDAKVSGSEIKVVGTGVCEDVWPDAETIKSISLM